MRPNPQFPANLVTFTEETLNWKLHFLRSDTMDLWKTLWKEVLQYRRQNKFVCLNYRSIIGREFDNVWWTIPFFFSFSILMELQANENENNEHVAQNFEALKYDSSESSGDILFDNSCDSDLHFFNTNIQNHHTPCPKNFKIS